MLKIFVPREVLPNETRTSVSLETATKLLKSGFLLTVEHAAGSAAAIPDEAFVKVGAKVVEDVRQGYADADLVLKFHPPREHPDLKVHEVELMQPGTVLISFLYPTLARPTVELLLQRKIRSLAMELVPRITRAQKMDALSSQSNIAGYKAVLLAAHYLPRMFPMMMTAAGTITPARVIVLGAGVAGLQAVATARRLGATVEVSDIRPQVKEQVESLGAKFIDVPTDGAAQDAGGYAREASVDYKQRQEAALKSRLRQADVVITTALIPGRPAPRLLSAEMAGEMPRGSVIVDIAAEFGGNCEWTEAGKVITHNGVTVIGFTHVASLVAAHATEVYARNVLAMVQHVTRDGAWALDLADEIVAGTLVTDDGRLVHPQVAQWWKT